MTGTSSVPAIDSPMVLAKPVRDQDVVPKKKKKDQIAQRERAVQDAAEELVHVLLDD